MFDIQNLCLPCLTYNCNEKKRNYRTGKCQVKMAERTWNMKKRAEVRGANEQLTQGVSVHIKQSRAYYVLQSG